MPRTFSLAALLRTITGFCLLCGFAVNDPETATMITPAFLVWLVLFNFSRRRIRMTMAFIGGALVSALLFWPPMMHRYGAPTPFHEFAIFLIIISIPIAIGGSLAAGAVFLDERFPQPSPSADRLDQDREIQRLLHR